MAEILLTQGFAAIVDDDDLPRLQMYKWHAARGGRGGVKVYATSRYRNSEGKKRTLYMHRFILSAPRGSEIDHINGDPLDNRKSNLRFCTRSQNMHNVIPKKPGKGSRYVGVVPHKKRWRARTKVAGKDKHIGTYDTEEQASEAYSAFVRKEFGAFAERKASITQLPLDGITTIAHGPVQADGGPSVT